MSEFVASFRLPSMEGDNANPYFEREKTMNNDKLNEIEFKQLEPREVADEDLQYISGGMVANNTWTYCSNCTCTSTSFNKCL